MLLFSEVLVQIESPSPVKNFHSLVTAGYRVSYTTPLSAEEDKPQVFHDFSILVGFNYH